MLHAGAQDIGNTQKPATPSGPRCGIIWPLRVILSFAWATIAIYVLIATTENPFNSSRLAVLNVVTIAPEGWGFFTKDPRLENTIVFKKSEGRWRLRTKRNAAPSTIFGLSRAERKADMETAALIGMLPKGAWRVTRLSDVNILKNAEGAGTNRLRNGARNPLVCGELVLVTRPPTPWAWSRQRRNVIMPSKFAHIAVQCPAAGYSGSRRID
jgi:antimicrobial peptide system SdpA family protein